MNHLSPNHFRNVHGDCAEGWRPDFAQHAFEQRFVDVVVEVGDIACAYWVDNFDGLHIIASGKIQIYAQQKGWITRAVAYYITTWTYPEGTP